MLPIMLKSLLGNEAITLENTTDAVHLNAINTSTTGIINAASITTLTGNADEIIQAYNAAQAGEITGLGDETITLTDASLDAGELNSINTSTGGIIDASSISTLTGHADELIQTYTAAQSNEISGLNDEIIILENLTIDAADLNSLNTSTSGIINASSITTLTGNAEELIQAYNAAQAGEITGVGNEVIKININQATTEQANTLAAATNGIVHATISEGDIHTLQELQEPGNAHSITVMIQQLTQKHQQSHYKTTVAINAAYIANLTGPATTDTTIFRC